VATGRASASLDLTAEEYEEVFRFLYGLSRIALSISRQPRRSIPGDLRPSNERLRVSRAGRLRRERWFRGSLESMPGKGSSLFRIRARSIPAASFQSQQAVSAGIR
jgi:hypothetical protein